MRARQRPGQTLSIPFSDDGGVALFAVADACASLRAMFNTLRLLQSCCLHLRAEPSLVG
jgi:hypothetical protein